ncbi:MAG: hypothetical protein AMJ81_08050 [Phycisphaerae bacterium SM23_33]|nr:MAG: hypothetical protein AMJ81_08050 [Phycisphaerae bacterium SM23_33]
MRWTLCLVVAALGWASRMGAEQVKCTASRDVWVSAFGGEENFNMGAAPRLKLKIYQEFAVVDFDVAALRGKTLAEAWLYVKPLGVAIDSSRGPYPCAKVLRWMTVSTVGHDWIEGRSTSYAKDTQGHGATWNESSFGRADWGWTGATLGDVAFGNGNTLRCDGKLQPEGEWLKLRLDPRLVQALVAGASHGLLLQDGNTTPRGNAFIVSREGGHPAYLMVTVTGPDGSPPGKVAELKVAPAAKLATAERGAIEVSFTVPKEAFTYRLSVDGQPVERWQIPFAAPPGRRQSLVILDLPAGRKVTVAVEAVDAAGNVSKAATAAGAVSDKLSVPELPAYGFSPKPGRPKPLGEAKVWAFPEVTKVDPVTGEVLLEEAAGDFRRANPVWDGAGGTVRLAAARGEIISFQVAVEGPAKGVKLAVSELRGAGSIPAAGVRLWRNWYVGRQSEYALPLKGAFDVPAGDNQVAGQKLQAVTVDIHVPPATPAGEYAGTVTVTAGQAKAELALKVKVYDAVIPQQVFFNPELNCYGGPGYAGSAKFKDSFRLAHYHRCTINRVPYTQRQPGASGDLWPKIDPQTGHVTDWSSTDKNAGPLLDGSLFADDPRAGVPVPTLYLPFNLGWPADYRKYYRAPEGFTTYMNNDFLRKVEFDAASEPIEQAMDPKFGEIFQTCVKDFLAHFTEKGWTRTPLQFYLNRKWTWGYSAWTLDEPVTTTDFLALRYLGGLFVEAAGDADLRDRGWHEALFARGLAAMQRRRPTFMFRTDISRPVVQGSIHDGIASVMYVNSGQFAYPRLMRGHKLRMPAVLYCYGSCNAVQRSNWESAAWCLKAYAHHCDGVLPWQSLAEAEALTKPNTEGLIVDGTKAGLPQAIASFRVHALRRGAQDCELLRLLQLKHGWSREHIALLASEKLGLAGEFQQKFADEAAAVKFGQLTSRGFCELKEGVLKLLTGQN